jgi:uncharacterized protein
MHWDFAIILLFLGIVVPWLGHRRVARLMEVPSTTTMDRLTLYASTIAFQTLAAGIILWRTAERHIRPAALGISLADKKLTAVVSLLLCLLVVINQVFAIHRLAAQPSEAKGLLPQLALKIFPQNEVEQLAFVALVATVALCEELIYRGFVQRVFEDAVQGLAVAGIVISAAFFSVAHLYQGRRGLLSTFVVGLLFASVRAWTGSLVPTLAAHFVTDAAAGFLAPRRLRLALGKAAAEVKDPEETAKTTRIV